MQIDAESAETRQTKGTVCIAGSAIGLRGMRRQRGKHRVLNFLPLERCLLQAMDRTADANRRRLADNEKKVASGFLNENFQPLSQLVG